MKTTGEILEEVVDRDALGEEQQGKEVVRIKLAPQMATALSLTPKKTALMPFRFRV